MHTICIGITIKLHGVGYATSNEVYNNIIISLRSQFERLTGVKP